MNSENRFICVVVHGLFFMWQNGNDLELIAPNINNPATPPHHYLGGVRGQLRRLSNPEDWRNIGLIGKRPSSPSDGLKPSVLQFSITETKLGGWSSDSSLFAGRILLPWPLQFYSLRCDDFYKTFKYVKPNIGKNIEQHCTLNNTRIGVITCLRYQVSPGVPLPPENIHCYFQPCWKHSIGEVNDDLHRAGRCFRNDGNFDLEMHASVGSVITPPKVNCPDATTETTDEDCYSLDDDPLRPTDLCPPAPVEIFNVNPANCPNFYVLP